MMFRSIYIASLFIFVAPVSATNFYVGLNYGATAQSGEFTIIDTNPPTGSTGGVENYQAPDDVSTTGGIYIGYKLGVDIALELGYAANSELVSPLRLDEGDNGALEALKTKYTYIAFVGLWPISNRWAFNARLGFSLWDIDYKHTDVNTLLDPSDSAYILQQQFLSDNTSATLVGVGISFGVTRNIELKLNVENHFVDFSFTNLELDYTAITYTFGVAYHF